MRPGSTLRLTPLSNAASLSAVIGAFNALQTGLAHDLGGLVLYQSVSTPAQITGNQNDYPIGSARVVRLSTDASRTISGFRNAGAGLVNVANAELTVINVGSQNIVFTHQDGASVAANRFLLDTGASLTLAANDAQKFYYDGATSRWRNISEPVSAFTGQITYGQLPTGNGSWDTGAGTTITITRSLTVSGTFLGTLSTAAQPNVTSLGTLTSLTVTGSTFSEFRRDSSGSIVETIRLDNQGTSANGTGVYLRFLALRAAGDLQEFAGIKLSVSDKTTSAEVGRIGLFNMVTGAYTEVLSFVGGAATFSGSLAAATNITATNGDFILGTNDTWVGVGSSNMVKFNNSTDTITAVCGGTTTFTLHSGVLTINTVPKFAGTNTTGAGSALIGAGNSPAVTNTNVYTWIQATAADGSTVYIPAWK